MASHQCPHCASIVNGLVETALGLACPACMKVIRGATAAKSLPGTTGQESALLDAVIGIALGVAVAKAIDKWF
jgi:hypothetical protein